MFLHHDGANKDQPSSTAQMTYSAPNESSLGDRARNITPLAAPQTLVLDSQSLNSSSSSSSKNINSLSDFHAPNEVSTPAPATQPTGADANPDQWMVCLSDDAF